MCINELSLSARDKNSMNHSIVLQMNIIIYPIKCWNCYNSALKNLGSREEE